MLQDHPGDAYIIDGISQALTPAGLLQECTLPGALPAPTPADSVADETVDIAPTPFDFRDEDIDAYADAVAALPRPPFPVPFAGPVTRSRIAKALLDAVWMGGHFRLGDHVFVRFLTASQPLAIFASSPFRAPRSFS